MIPASGLVKSPIQVSRVPEGWRITAVSANCARVHAGGPFPGEAGEPREDPPDERFDVFRIENIEPEDTVVDAKPELAHPPRRPLLVDDGHLVAPARSLLRFLVRVRIGAVVGDAVVWCPSGRGSRLGE